MSTKVQVIQKKPTLAKVQKKNIKSEEQEDAADQNPIRRNAIKNLTQVFTTLLTQTHQATEPTSTHLARSIESALFRAFQTDEPYKTKIRSLLYNLKDKANTTFQTRVLTGQLTPDQLLQLSSEEMANPSLKSLAHEMRQNSIKDSVLKSPPAMHDWLPPLSSLSPVGHEDPLDDILASLPETRRVDPEMLSRISSLPEKRSGSDVDPELKRQRLEREMERLLEDPPVWVGQVKMVQVAEFEAVARQIGGRPLSQQEWQQVLSPTMWIEGRIPVDRVTSYVTQTQYSQSREIVLLQIEAKGSGTDQCQVLLDYFESRQRYGVVGHNKTRIKDFYLIPLYKTQLIPDCLYVVRVEETKREVDMFLGVLVLTKHPHQPLPPPPPSLPVVQDYYHY